jgi:hypothetical protein
MIAALHVVSSPSSLMMGWSSGGNVTTAKMQLRPSFHHWQVSTQAMFFALGSRLVTVMVMALLDPFILTVTTVALACK